MILAVDIGNTNVVLGGIEAGKILFEARIATDLIKTSDQYAVELKNILSLYEVTGGDFEGSIISSVVPPVLNSFRTAIRKLTGKLPLVVGPGIKTGLNILIDNPSQTGGDLIVGAVAAIHEYEPPMALIDMGTATTLSVIDGKGYFLGGAIMAGVNLCLNALNSGTSQLPKIDLHNPGKVIGSNTDECMKSGAVYGTACMLDGLIDRVEKELGEKVTVVGTGGLAPVIMRHCTHDIILEDDLLLLGLGVIYAKNTRR